MSEDKRGFFAKIFIALMIFTALVWAWTVAFIISWPWEKNSTWKPEFRVAAVCANKEPCGLAYSELAEAKAKGLYTTLEMPEPAGDIEEAANWLKWKKENGIYEVKASSWHFQTTIRYKVEDDVPVLVEYQDVAAKAFYYGVAAGLFSLIGIYLRKLRN
ncbi:hypothetical protein GBK02_06755 [Dechloromonas sp. TW-R-39-2]|uniref:hypothetical protein n=1 Tax=Dechloromonas sp. TW-R-39-2 TaxID=2654218 RepID=UPI00193E2080|nr:hypothetical protein [Dechloromonas sp. TW-R-39-2]QRM19112.1 hypothetical protein GBK02_06755 [Dechloromonas sp. TW-R-39-2]